jgi:predicted secreted protein
MMRMAKPAALSSSLSEPLSVEPGKATVTATVNGTVQMQ